MSADTAPGPTPDDAKMGQLGALFVQCHVELKKLASAVLRRGWDGAATRATALVDEVYLRLISQRTIDPADRKTFLQTAALAMQQVLLDRKKWIARSKRGGGRERVPLDDSMLVANPSLDLLTRIADAVVKLEEIDPRLAEVFELDAYVGASIAEIADIIGRSELAARRLLHEARTVLVSLVTSEETW